MVQMGFQEYALANIPADIGDEIPIVPDQLLRSSCPRIFTKILKNAILYSTFKS